jgi:flagellar hook-associated protein 2
MATISALGIGSGLDLTGLLDQLDSAERQKLVPMINKRRSFEAKLSAFGQLRSSLDAFQSATSKLKQPDIFDSAQSTVSGDALTAAARSGAKPGTYDISVAQLARAYSVATVGLEDRDSDLGAGTVSISMADGTTLSVDMSADSSTLESLRDRINELNAGVSATIINDGSAAPYRLSLASTATGQDAAIASVDFGALGTSLSLDASTEVAARNAGFRVNGVDIVSQDNQVEDAIEGVTLSLDEVGDATLAVTVDEGKIQAALTGFVSAYNKLQAQIDKLTRFDQESGDAGDLLGDSTLRSVRSRLRSTFVNGVEGGPLQRLSDIGISLQLDGTLEADEDRISEMIQSDRAALKFFFTGDGETSGLADSLDEVLTNVLSSGGLLETSEGGLDNRLEILNNRFDRRQQGIDRTMERYRKQFARLDGLVASMNQTSGYIAQQFDILNAQMAQSRNG